MADKFDPYREALVMETDTEWPEQYADLAPTDKARIATALHASPEEASELEYVRTHTGFCRRIIATPEEIERANSA